MLHEGNKKEIERQIAGLEHTLESWHLKVIKLDEQTSEKETPLLKENISFSSLLGF